MTSIDEQDQQVEVFAEIVRTRTAVLESANNLLREETGKRARAESTVQAVAVEPAHSNEEMEEFSHVRSHDHWNRCRLVQAFGDWVVKSESISRTGRIRRSHDVSRNANAKAD